MIPGGGGMNPRQLKQMMKKLGIEVEEFPEVLEVVIRTKEGTYRVDNAEVTKMTAQGEETLQIQGDITQTEEAKPQAIGEMDDSEVEVEITDEDVELVVEQSGASEEDARAALEEVGGNPAEAIIKLQSG